MGKGAGCYSLCSQNVFGLLIDVEQETVVANDWIGCNFKPFRGYTLTATKCDQFGDFPTPSVCKTEQ